MICVSHGVCVQYAETADFPQFQLINKVVNILVVVQRPIPMVFCCSADQSNFPVAVLGQADRWPCCAGRAGFPRSFTLPVVWQRQVPCHVPQLLFINKVVHHPCPGAEFDPHLVDHRDSPVAVHTVVDVLPVSVVRVPQLPSCGTVVLPQLQLVEKVVTMRRR